MNNSVKIYLAKWIFWSDKDKEYYYTEPIVTPYINFDWLSKSELHVRRAIKTFGENNLTLTNQFHCFKGNQLREENCVRGIIYTKYLSDSNLDEEEYKQGFTNTVPEDNPFKDDKEIKESFVVQSTKTEVRNHIERRTEVVVEQAKPVKEEVEKFDWDSF